MLDEILGLNCFQIVASCVVSSYGYVLDGAKLEERDEEDRWRQEMINAALEVINGELCEKLCGIDPTKLRDADTIITYEHLHKYFNIPSLYDP